jgi:hypothetical protein
MSSLGHIALSIIRMQLVYRDGVPLALLGDNRAMVSPRYVFLPVFPCTSKSARTLKPDSFYLLIPGVLLAPTNASPRGTSFVSSASSSWAA